MISGINLTEIVEYTLKGDIENPTIWKLGIIPTKILAQMSSMKDQINMAYVILQVGIKGWVNFQGVEYTTVKEKILGTELDVVSQDLINRIPLTAIAELSTKIIEVNKLTVGEIKN